VPATFEKLRISKAAPVRVGTPRAPELYPVMAVLRPQWCPEQVRVDMTSPHCTAAITFRDRGVNQGKEISIYFGIDHVQYQEACFMPMSTAYAGGDHSMTTRCCQPKKPGLPDIRSIQSRLRRSFGDIRSRSRIGHAQTKIETC
jgi:hypothetical protein